MAKVRHEGLLFPLQSEVDEAHVDVEGEEAEVEAAPEGEHEGLQLDQTGFVACAVVVACVGGGNDTNATLETRFRL